MEWIDRGVPPRVRAERVGEDNPNAHLLRGCATLNRTTFSSKIKSWNTAAVRGIVTC